MMVTSEKSVVKEERDEVRKVVLPPVLRGSKELLINRELSLLEFFRRVLEEALDETQPLLERLKFLAIFSSNLDEFFMIRISALKEQLFGEVTHLSPDGRTPESEGFTLHFDSGIASPNLAAVPEPSSVLMLVIGTVGLLGVGWRR